MSVDESSSAAQQKQGVVALPGEPCHTAPRPEWSEPEKWVWQQVCEGKIADFNQRYGELDPKTPDGWSETREIAPSFLETILTRKPYKSALPRQGVRIIGALVRQEIDLENGSLCHQWSLDKSRIEADVKLSQLQSTSTISFQESVFIGTRVNLSGAKAGGQLDMTDATCTGTLDMDALEVGSHLLMRGRAVFGQKVYLTFADIGGNFDISGGQFDFLDLTETSIRGELCLGSSEYGKPIWQKGSRFVLRNTVVTTIRAPRDLDAWPDSLDLGGCTYTRLGGVSTEDEEPEMASYEPEWFVGWLKKDRTYSPQPFQQLAGVLCTMGHPEKANTILYEGEERERSEEKTRGHWSKWLGLSLLKWTTGYGYGYRYFRSLVWVILFTIVGAVVVNTTGIGKGLSPPKMLGFSFDLLLPLVKLDESHAKILSDGISITGWQYYYFYVHKLVGYILASFVAAGLSGITKK